MSTHRMTKPLLIAAAATAMVGSLGGYIWHEDHRPRVLEIFVFALKSGRSMFIRTPDDRRILVDGGSNGEIIRELTRILPFYSRRIDAVIATDALGKDVSGLIDVIDRYMVDRAYVPAATLESLSLSSTTDQIYASFMDALDKKQINIEPLSAGQTLRFGASTTLRVMFPADAGAFAYSRASAPEILFSLTFDKTSVTFMGNASNKVQRFMATSGDSATSTEARPVNEVRPTDILIVSHSALPENMAAPLATKLRPRYLVYSKAPAPAKSAPAKPTDKLSKKKPTPDPFASIGRERRFNLKESGTVQIISDGIEVQIKSAPWAGQ